MLDATSSLSPTISRPFAPTGDGGEAPVTTQPIARFEPDGRILGFVPGPPTPPPPPDGPITVIVNNGNGSNGSGTPTPVPEAQSSLADALASLSSIISGFGSTAPAASQPQTVAVPVQNASSDTTTPTQGKSVVIIAGIVLGLAAAGYYGYKHGWFSKKKKAAEAPA